MRLEDGEGVRCGWRRKGKVCAGSVDGPMGGFR